MRAPILRSHLCDYSVVYKIAKGSIDLLAAAANEDDEAEKDVVFKHNASLRPCTSNINNILIDDSEDFDIVMPMYNLFQYSHNCSMTLGDLRNYYRNELDDVEVNNNAWDGKTFEYKIKITRKTPEKPRQPGNPGDVDEPVQPRVPA